MSNKIYYIQGNYCDPSKVIEALEDKGGINNDNVSGNDSDAIYFFVDGVNDNLIELAFENSAKAFLVKTYGTKLTLSEKNIKDRIKTFDDAYKWCMENNHKMICSEYDSLCSALYGFTQKADCVTGDIVAYLKLRIVSIALNEGWQPQFAIGEDIYTIDFNLIYKDDFPKEYKETHADIEISKTYSCDYKLFAYSSTFRSSTILDSTNIYFKNKDLAVYCGNQFIDLWAEYYLARKQ